MVASHVEHLLLLLHLLHAFAPEVLEVAEAAIVFNVVYNRGQVLLLRRPNRLVHHMKVLLRRPGRLVQVLKVLERYHIALDLWRHHMVVVSLRDLRATHDVMRRLHEAKLLIAVLPSIR